MLHHIACERHGEVVAQTLLGRFGSLGAAVLNAEQQFVAFLAVLAHQGREVLHSRSLYLLEAVQGIDATNGVEDVVATGHLHRTEVASALGYAGFHINLY